MQDVDKLRHRLIDRQTVTDKRLICDDLGRWHELWPEATF